MKTYVSAVDRGYAREARVWTSSGNSSGSRLTKYNFSLTLWVPGINGKPRSRDTGLRTVFTTGSLVASEVEWDPGWRKKCLQPSLRDPFLRFSSPPFIGPLRAYHSPENVIKWSGLRKTKVVNVENKTRWEMNMYMPVDLPLSDIPSSTSIVHDRAHLSKLRRLRRSRSKRRGAILASCAGCSHMFTLL